MNRLAIVLMNLGGPDGQDAVRPFLFNLFNDAAIISLPQPLRWMLAQLISRRRAPAAREIYGHLGGGSPLLPNTEAQAAALKTDLEGRGLAQEVRCFIAMRYWHPMTEDAVTAVKEWRPDHIVLAPLYPQYSTTTSRSSFREWKKWADRKGLNAPTSMICCYPLLTGFIEATANGIRRGLKAIAVDRRPRVLFSAHGLPQKVVASGDPYQVQVEQTASAVAAALKDEELDSVVCYQSRVGPLEWIRPYTVDEIRRAGREGVPLIVAPIAFVSEHSETLVELDIEYRELAKKAGVPDYYRVATVGTEQSFIASLGAMIAGVGDARLCCGGGSRLCPADRTQCAFSVAP